MTCWVPGNNGSVPPEAFVGGEDSSGETIYIARAFFNGGLIPGKIKKKVMIEREILVQT